SVKASAPDGGREHYYPGGPGEEPIVFRKSRAGSNRYALGAMIDSEKSILYQAAQDVGERPSYEAVKATEHTAASNEEAKQLALRRDIFGHFFGPVTNESLWLPYEDGSVRWSLAPSMREVRVESSWLSYQNGIVWEMAQAIYDERAFHRLPLLANV